MATYLAIRPDLVKAAREASRKGQSLPWTPKLALAVLVDATEEIGKVPAQVDLVFRYGCASDGTYRRLFGSMQRARWLAEDEVARRKEASDGK